MQPLREFDLTPSHLLELKGAWNIDGYQIPATLEPLTRMVRLPLDGIRASDPSTGRLARFIFSPAATSIEVLVARSTHGFAELRPHRVHVDRYDIAPISRDCIADVCWSSQSGTLYVLDIIHALVYRFNFWETEYALPPIELPRNLALSLDSRLIIRRDRDSSLYATVPDDHIIVQIEESTGKVETRCGKAGQGNPGSLRTGFKGTTTSLFRPTLIEHDPLTNQLLFYNAGDAQLYYLDRSGIVKRLIDTPLDFVPSGLLLYRLSDFVDILQLRPSAPSAAHLWGRQPTLLLIGAPSLNALYKIHLNSQQPKLSRFEALFLPEIDRLLLMQNGELLITNSGSTCSLLNTQILEPNSLQDNLAT